MLKTSCLPPIWQHMEKGRIQVWLSQGRELTCTAARFLRFAPRKLVWQVKETRHIVLLFPSQIHSLCYEIQFTGHLHWKKEGRRRGILVQRRSTDLQHHSPQSPGADDKYW